VTWRLPHGRHRAKVRVVRSGRVVGETSRRSIRVAVIPGRRTRISVGFVGAHGGAPRCRALIYVQTEAASQSALPAPLLDASVVSATRVELSWQSVKGARAYRVVRGSATVKQRAGQTLTVTLAAGRTYRYTVAAVDEHGHPGRPSNAVTLNLGHRPPQAPSGLALTAATPSTLAVSWQPAQGQSAPVRAYRVLRDGPVVGSTTYNDMVLQNLFAQRTYQLQVEAVDSQGYVSAPTAALAASTLAPTQTTGQARLFVLASTDSSFADFRAHYQQVGTIYPTYFNCSPATGQLVTGTDNQQITTWAQVRGVRVVPRYNCQNPSFIDQLLNDPQRIQALAAQLANLVVTYGYQGINVDIEAGPPADRDAYTALVGELAAALHQAGATLSIDVSPKVADVPNHPRSTFFDYPALSSEADELVVLSWELHWTTSAPGSSIDIRWFTQVYDYVASLPNHDRFVLAVPLYAMDWPAGGGLAHPAAQESFQQIQALIGQTGAIPALDEPTDEWHFTYTDANGVGHDVWYSDAQTLGDHLALAAQRGLAGVALWRAGQEDQALWSDPVLGGAEA
jgi:spore germination protein YaaH